MAKVILEFDTNEEAEDIRCALDGWKWKTLVFEIDQMLRNKLKYPSETISNELYTELEKLRNEIQELVSDSNLSINY